MCVYAPRKETEGERVAAESSQERTERPHQCVCVCVSDRLGRSGRGLRANRESRSRSTRATQHQLARRLPLLRPQDPGPLVSTRSIPKPARLTVRGRVRAHIRVGRKPVSGERKGELPPVPRPQTSDHGPRTPDTELHPMHYAIGRSSSEPCVRSQ